MIADSSTLIYSKSLKQPKLLINVKLMQKPSEFYKCLKSCLSVIYECKTFDFYDPVVGP